MFNSLSDDDLREAKCVFLAIATEIRACQLLVLLLISTMRDVLYIRGMSAEMRKFLPIEKASCQKTEQHRKMERRASQRQWQSEDKEIIM
jgi:hypothetical protein